jgi:zinc-ribbon domain
LPFCPNCGKETLASDRFCLNCGQTLQPVVGGAAKPQTPGLPASGPARAKSPAAAGVLNFLFPGIGYVYTGVGRDSGELVFGLLVFLFYFVGFEVSIVLVGLTSPPVTPGTQYSPYAGLILLAYLLPFAFAYDGYRRASFS